MIPDLAQLITLIILLALTGSYLIGTAADLLNLKHLDQPLPGEFSDHFDAQRYADSQQYLRINTYFGLITSTIDLIVILLFWFCKGFQLIDAWVRSFEFSATVSGLLFIGTLLLLKSLISLPFTAYSTFVIENRFGFNKTSWLTFITDYLKTMVLTCVLGGGLLSLILLFFQSKGPYAWAMCWAAATVFMIAVQYIIPTWILPLFNKFTQLEDGHLRNEIFNYANSINFSLSNVFVMDGSKRSTKSNAFFTGFGKNKRIVLFDTLLKNQTVEELVAILAHEMGHFKKRHIIRRMVLMILQMGLIFYLLSLFISSRPLFDAFYMEQMSVYAGLIFFAMLYSPIDFFLSVVLQAVSRKDEYEADRFAASTTEKSKPLIKALKKLSADNLSNLTPHPLYVFLYYSHPPVLERIKALRAN